MVDASRMENVLTDAPHPVGQTGWGLFFIFLIKKGKKRDDKDTKGYEKSKYCKDDHDHFIIRHRHHLLNSLINRD